MAKKARKKPHSREAGSLSPGLLHQVYPAIAQWASGYGWVEFGIDGRDRPFVRALDEGGTVWEGEEEYESPDEALRSMEKGLGEFMEEEGFDGGRGGEMKQKPLAARPVKPKPRKGSSPKETSPKRDDRLKAEVIPAVPRSIVEKVRKFDEIAEALRRGHHFEITRLTSLKGLCKDPHAARSFAMFLAEHARRRAGEKDIPERFRGLISRAITEMESYLDDPTNERKERLYPLLREIEKEQDEHERIAWGMVRIAHSMELLVVEKALKSILREEEAPAWLYQAARDYAERYDSRHGTGLIPDSAPMMQEIADFWRGYHGLDR